MILNETPITCSVWNLAIEDFVTNVVGVWNCPSTCFCLELGVWNQRLATVFDELGGNCCLVLIARPPSYTNLFLFGNDP